MFSFIMSDSHVKILEFEVLYVAISALHGIRFLLLYIMFSPLHACLLSQSLTTYSPRHAFHMRVPKIA